MNCERLIFEHINTGHCHWQKRFLSPGREEEIQVVSWSWQSHGAWQKLLHTVCSNSACNQLLFHDHFHKNHYKGGYSIWLFPSEIKICICLCEISFHIDKCVHCSPCFSPNKNIWMLFSHWWHSSGAMYLKSSPFVHRFDFEACTKDAGLLWLSCLNCHLDFSWPSYMHCCVPSNFGLLVVFHSNH